MPWRWASVGMVAVLGMLLGVVAWAGGDDCERAWARVDAPVETWFGSPEDLDHDDHDIAELLDAAAEFGEPFGELRSAAAFDDLETPRFLAVGGDAAVHSGRTVSILDMPDGAVRWSRQLSGRQPLLTGMDDLMVGIANPDREQPVVAVFDPEDGRSQACTRLPARSSNPIPAAMEDHSVLVVAYPVTGESGRGVGSVVAGLDPVTTEELWRFEIDRASVGSLEILEDVVAVSLPRILTGDLFDFGVGPAPDEVRDPVLFHSVTDGSFLGAYPERGDASGAVVAQMIGVDTGTATFVIEHVDLTDESMARNFSGVSGDGALRWTRTVDDARYTRSYVASDTVLVSAIEEEGPMLHGWDAADGSDRWSVALHAGGSFDSARNAVAGSTLFVPAGEAILVVDLESNEHELIEVPWFVRHLDAAGGHLMVTTWHPDRGTDVVLVFEPSE